MFKPKFRYRKSNAQAASVVTQHRTAARRVVVSLYCFAYHKMLRLLPHRGLVGSQGLKRTKTKYAGRQRLYRNSLPNEDLPFERFYQPKKLDFLQTQSSDFCNCSNIFCHLQIIFELTV